MHIRGMTIGGIPPFTEPVDFEFNERVNLFIGPNATGKTTLLRGLYSRFEDDPSFSMRWSSDWQSKSAGLLADSSSRLKPGWELVPWVYVSAVRMNLPVSADGSAMSELLNQSTWEVAFEDQGASTGGLLDLARRNLYKESLEWYYFDGRIMHIMYGALNSLVKEGRADAVLLDRMQVAKEIAYECSRNICPDILKSGRFPSDYTNTRVPQSGKNNLVYKHYDMGISTTDNTESNLFLGDLSSGTQGTLLWIWYLAFRIADFYLGCEGWQTKPAILLIDEIENHLHPTWQRRVIPALLKHFPGLQIFATTHSPFVVAGLKAGQVHLLNRDENGVITATSNTEDILGWTADEILRVYMGVEEPTDEPTARAAQELRRLRNEGKRVNETEEKERQSEMARLRRIVSHTELSGPRAAEDARFLTDLRSILDQYSHSQDLNQENA